MGENAAWLSILQLSVLERCLLSFANKGHLSPVFIFKSMPGWKWQQSLSRGLNNTYLVATTMINSWPRVYHLVGTIYKCVTTRYYLVGTNDAWSHIFIPHLCHLEGSVVCCVLVVKLKIHLVLSGQETCVCLCTPREGARLQGFDCFLKRHGNNTTTKQMQKDHNLKAA